MKERCLKRATMIIDRLKAQENAERSQDMRKYFKNAARHFLGVGIPAVQKTIKKTLTEFSGARHDDITETADLLLKTDIMEVQIAGIELLCALKERLSVREAFFRTERWILDGRINNWASVDAVSTHLLGWLAGRDNSLSEETMRWSLSPNSWLRRASAVTYILPAREGRFLDVVYETALRLRSDEDEYVRKGAGWVLREAGKTDMERLSRFLYEHGGEMARVTLRYAAEKFPPEERLKLLEATKKG